MDIRTQHAQIRDALRRQIRQDRTILRKGRSWLPCIFCGGDVSQGFHIHEVFVNRAPVPMAAQHLIFTMQNVGQICPACHRRWQGTPELLKRGMAYLMDVEGAGQIAAWYLDVAPQLGLSTGTVPDDGDWVEYLKLVFG